MMAKPMKTLELHYPLDRGDLSGGERYTPFEQPVPGPFSDTQRRAFGKGTFSRERSVARSIECHNSYLYSGNDKLARSEGSCIGLCRSEGNSFPAIKSGIYSFGFNFYIRF